jgi:cyclopropane fatty-acyl-phospholipid synthase-like methyltransferase
LNKFNSQFAHPEELAGSLVGMIMAVKNRERNAWTVALMDLEPGDHVLEIGFGPGQAIQEVAKLTPKGFVGGIDLSYTMLLQASKRNSAAIRSRSTGSWQEAGRTTQADRFQRGSPGEQADQTN